MIDIKKDNDQEKDDDKKRWFKTKKLKKLVRVQIAVCVYGFKKTDF